MDNGDMVDVIFTVNKETMLGEEVSIVGSLKELGRWQPGRHGVLQTGPHEYPVWSRTIRLPRSQVEGGVEYKFVLLKTDGQTEWEEGPNRILPSPMCENHAKLSLARFGHIEPTGSEPHSSNKAASLPRASFSRQTSEGTVEVRFEVLYKFTQPKDNVVIVGSIDSLGDWQPANGLSLTTSNELFPTWTATTKIPSGMSVEWKIVVIRACGHVDWEEKPNRNFVSGTEDNIDGWIVKARFDGPREIISKPQVRRNDDDPKRAAGEWKTCTSTMAVSPLVAAQAVSPLVAAQRRCTSMSMLTTFNHKGVDSPASDDPSVVENNLIRRNSGSAAPPQEQLVILSLADVAIDERIAEWLHVEVAFEGCDVRQTLAFDNEKDHWALPAGLLGLPDGLHIFHFLICGVRIVSSAHPISGDSNLAIFSDSLRRYLAVRDGSGFTIDETDAVRKMSSTSSVGARTFSPRTGENTPLQKGRLLAAGGRAGGMVRPLSHAGNLSLMVDSDSDEEQHIHFSPREMTRTRTPFDLAKFEGFFDRDLRWRLDRVLPQLPEPSLNEQHRRSVRLWPGAKRIGKQIGMCEDAFFCEQYGAGVADGVGQFAHYKDCNAAEYAKELMDHAREFLLLERSAAKATSTCDRSTDPTQVKSITKERAQAAMTAADERAQAYGGSTILVLALEGHTIGVANLGDSGFMLLRRAQGGMKVVHCSTEQQHQWNQPYQLMRLPPSLAAKYPRYKEKADKPSDCEGYAVDVQEGDLLLLFTDGLSDNLFRDEILDIVDGALAPRFAELLGIPAEVSTSPDSIANALATVAQERSLSESAKVPFNENAKKFFDFDFKGGKQDDITVVAAWVMPKQEEIVPNSRRVLQAEKLQLAVEKITSVPQAQVVEKTLQAEKLQAVVEKITPVPQTQIVEKTLQAEKLQAAVEKITPVPQAQDVEKTNLKAAYESDNESHLGANQCLVNAAVDGNLELAEIVELDDEPPSP